MDRRFLFLLSSARPAGNSARLARVAAEDLPATDQQWIDLAALQLPPYRDLRPGTALPNGDLADVMNGMHWATDIVLVAPVYWYALPAPAKLLMDHWSGWFDAAETGFATWARGKTVYLVTARADPDPTVTAPVATMVQRSVLWLGMHWGGALHGVGDAVGDVAQDAAAMAAARGFLRARP
jgi:multimeric flavodoxin WrbA